MYSLKADKTQYKADKADKTHFDSVMNPIHYGSISVTWAID